MESLLTLLETASNTGFFHELCKSFKNTFFIEHLLAAASILCTDFVDISYEDSHTHARRLYVAAANLFLKSNFILVCGMFFLIDGNVISDLITAYVSHYGKFTALHN